MILIQNARVIDPANSFDEISDVLIEDKKISRIEKQIDARDLENVKRIDASGKILAPGLVDMHAHLREPGQESKENFIDGAKSAALGGFTTVATMPNTNPVVDNAALVRSMKARAAEAIIKIEIIGAVTKNQKGEQLAEMLDMIDAGAVAFSDDGHFVDNARIFLNALDYLAPTGKLAICHEEETSLVEGGSMNEGRRSAVFGVKGRPTVAEDIAVARDCLLAEYSGGRVHIAHISSARSVEIVRDAKSRGVHVTAEATPHHLTMTEDLVTLSDTMTKVNPPLRTLKDVNAVVTGLKDGTIDCIVTDHSPHAFEEKDREYNRAPSGFPGLTRALALLIRKLVREGKISMPQLISKMTFEPAKIFGLLDKGIGTLSIGTPADLVLIAPNFNPIAENPIDLTMCDGKILVCDGKLVD